MTKQEFLNWMISNPKVENVYKDYIRENPDRAYAVYLDRAGTEIPVTNPRPVQSKNSGIVGTYRSSSGKGGGDITRVGDWLKRFREGSLNFNGPTGGAAPVTQYDESLDKISFNPGLEDLWHRISGESEEAQAKRLQDDNIYQRKYIDSNYMRYPQFYRDIINPGYEKDIQDRTKYMQDRGLNT